MPTALQSTAAGWLLISLGHTVHTHLYHYPNHILSPEEKLSAKDWQTLPQVRTLPNLAYTCARAGWYQGSGFFLMNGTFLSLEPRIRKLITSITSYKSISK
ncbi:hypothetical protein G4B84_011374 [Aspergillus flavus NRRL3357]|nr:uncharacterized protein G4B84_011374 [Aspergillus flavus NRRL3357]QMW35845.1 hypothetical protein G4B84_011374 [Aspergillus flavus NRRL3357]QMW47907.1 hypothetical protein G4B11_011425 [Aspergillus flavus]